jgi:hypothetical protein
MIYFYCSAVEYLSLDRINNTRVGLVGGQRIVSPSSSACPSPSLVTSRPPPVQATALLRGIGLELNVLHLSALGRTPPSSPFLSLTPYLEDAPLGSPRTLCILCLGPDLRIPVQICLPPNSLEARSRSHAFTVNPHSPNTTHDLLLKHKPASHALSPQHRSHLSRRFYNCNGCCCCCGGYARIGRRDGALRLGESDGVRARETQRACLRP